MNNQEIKNFQEYFTSHVNELNKKQIIKSVVDNCMLKHHNYTIYVCDIGDCLCICSLTRMEMCFFCDKKACKNCEKDFMKCWNCNKVSCQQKGCYKVFTIISPKTWRGPYKRYRCDECHHLHIEKQKSIKVQNVVSEIDDKISLLKDAIEYVKDNTKGTVK